MSGWLADVNQAAYFAFLEPGDTVLAMDLSHGGHLTHGAPVSHMGRVFKFERYKSESGQGGAIDFDGLMRRAKETRPKLVLCGYSSYPRDYDYTAFKRVADEVGALTMADISHIGGLVAADAMRNPLDAGFDVVTTTTHKSLRGPRGGLILCKAAHARKIDAAVFPGLQGGPHMNNVAGAAVTFKKAAEPAFKDYAHAILRNARALARALMDDGVKLITDGTDNHLMVIATPWRASVSTGARRKRRSTLSASRPTSRSFPTIRGRPCGRAACASARLRARRAAWTRTTCTVARGLDGGDVARAGGCGGDGEDAC